MRFFWVIGRVDNKKKEQQEESLSEDGSEVQAPQYQEKPKLVVDHLGKLNLGLDKLLASWDGGYSKKEVEKSVIEELAKRDWEQVEVSPEIWGGRLEKKPKKPVTKTQEKPKIIDIYLKPSLGAKIKEVKAGLKKEKFAGAQEVCVNILQKDGSYKKAKGSFYVDKLLLKSFGEVLRQ